MNTRPLWEWDFAQWRAYRAQLRFGIRVTVAAIAALLIAQLFALPLHGLWVVLTATVVTQLSVGGSLRAVLEYILGTLGGAIYAGVVGLLIPQTSFLMQIGVLALTVAPLAFAAALNPNFRVAPFSAVLVLLISGQLAEGPVQSALIQVFEVSLGGAVAVVVSLLIMPESAHRLAREAVARVLDELANVLPRILAGFVQTSDRAELQKIQDRIGRAVGDLRRVIDEIERERAISFVSTPDAAPLPRTLLRLRHDFVMIGRASTNVLPEPLRDQLAPVLKSVADVVSDYLRGCARALTSHQEPPPFGPLQDELDACASQITPLRQNEQAHLSAGQLEQLFVLVFALEQLQRNIEDLERRIREWAQPPGRLAKKPVSQAG